MAQTQQLTSLFILVCPQQPGKKKTFLQVFFVVVLHACGERGHVHACHTCIIHVTSISADRKQRSGISCSASCACPAGLRSLHVAHRKLFSPWQRGGGGGVVGGGQPSRTINRKLKGCEGGGGVKKAFRTRGHLHNVHIDCYLQVQQSFKFPVE